LEDDAGTPLRSFDHDGGSFVLGFEGARYNVRIRNSTSERVEAVLSIDGRDAISGRVGDYVGLRGYIVPPHDSIVVSGFRQTLDTVARFRFSAPSRSYSARMGTPENVGVIGVAFFPERRVWQPIAPFARTVPAPESSARRDRPAAGSPRKSAADDARGADEGEATREQRLGTEYGESSDSSVVEVPFVRANATSPAVIHALTYDDEDGLLSRGIDLAPPSLDGQTCRSVSECGPPEPFPRNRFAPPPP
jgi:hypothetical protein